MKTIKTANAKIQIEVAAFNEQCERHADVIEGGKFRILQEVKGSEGNA